MNQVVRNETTKRKLDWKQEEQMRSGKKRGEQRRLDRKVGRDVKSYHEGSEEE